MNYLVARDGQQHGPYTREEIAEGLRAGWLRPEDLIWHEGLPEWKRVDELFEVARVPEDPGETPYPKAAAPVAPFAAEPESSLPARTLVMRKKAPQVRSPGSGGTPNPGNSAGLQQKRGTPNPGNSAGLQQKRGATGTETRRKGGLIWALVVFLILAAGLLLWLGLTQ